MMNQNKEQTKIEFMELFNYLNNKQEVVTELQI